MGKLHSSFFNIGDKCCSGHRKILSFIDYGCFEGRLYPNRSCKRSNGRKSDNKSCIEKCVNSCSDDDGIAVRFLLGGSVVIETVFSWPGLGRLLIDSVSFRDYPVIQAEMLLFSLEFILINLVVDILYGFLNPQIRY